MPGPVTSIGGFVPRGISPTARQQPTVRLAPLPKPRLGPRLPDKVARVVEAKAKNRRSIMGQIGGVFGGLIPGALHLAKDVGTDIVNTPRLVYRSAQSSLHGQKPGHTLPERMAAIRRGEPDPGSGINADELMPFSSGLSKSFVQTAGRVAQLGPIEVNSISGDKIQTYGDKYREGDIVNAVLSDALNLSVAAGGLGVGLRAGAEAAGATRLGVGLGRAADVATSAARLGGRAANAPLELTTGVLRGGKSLLRDIGQTVKGRLYRDLPKEGPIGSRIAMAATPEGRITSAAMKEATSAPIAETRLMMGNLAKESGLLGKDRPSLVEQEVALSRLSGVAQANDLLAQQIGPAAALRSHVAAVEPGVTMTPEGAVMHAAYKAGTLPPEQMARIDAVTAAARKQLELRTENSLQGTGLIKGPMDPAYLGDAPLNEQVTRRLEESGMDPADSAALQQMVDQGATWDQLKPLVPELSDILLDPQVYPKPWREAMNVMAKGTEKGGAVGLPRTPEQMLAAGMERPTWMPTTESRIGNPEAPSTVPITTGLGSGLSGVASEHHSAAYGTGPYSLATLAEGIGKNISTTKFNEVIQKYVANAEIPSAGKVLTHTDPNLLADLRAQAERFVADSELGGLSKPEFAKRVDERFGRLVNDALAEQGYVVLKGNRADPQIGDFDPSKAAHPSEINADSVVVPKGVRDRMVQHRIGKESNVALELNKITNSFFKRNVLAFNLHWTMGDAISNQLMGWVSGAVDPVTMARGMMDVKRLEPQVFDEMFNRSNFTRTGMRQQAVEAFDPIGKFARKPARTTIGKGIRAVQDRAFKINAAVNGIQREGWSLVKLERELKARGLSSVDAMGTNPARWKDPQVQSAINDVINESNRIFGVMDEMSPFEQRTLTQLFPFWAWTRHITTLAARTAIDNPARVAWTLRIGAIGMNTSPQDMPAWMSGSLDNPFSDDPKSRFNMNWANPFYDVGTGGLASPGAATRSLAPLIKLGITAATNRDPNRDLNVVSHRPGTDPSRFGSVLYQAANATPFTRGAVNLAPTVDVPGLGLGLGPVRRYGSGQTIIDKTTGEPAPSGSRWRMALNMVNTPLPTTYVPTQATEGTAPSSPVRRFGLRSTGLSGGLKRVGLRG